MNLCLHALHPGGSLPAMVSKSHLHRLLIAAAFADKETVLRCSPTYGDDIAATVRCLAALGVRICRGDGFFAVQPLCSAPEHAVLDAGESGSTLRFLLPVLGALGTAADIHLHGRLALRPLSPLREALEAHGMTITLQENILSTSGKLCGGNFTFDGGISSQFATGMLFAMPHLPPSTLTLTGTIVSRPYLDMTLSVLRSFGYRILRNGTVFSVEKASPAPSLFTAEGDWSNAACLLVMGAFSEKGMTITGLDPVSVQGDRAILPLLQKFGAEVRVQPDGIFVRAGERQALGAVDVSAIPDLVPLLAVLAASADGRTVLEHCGRLRLKESDRIASVCALLHALGGTVQASPDTLCIDGGSLHGGTVDACGDHRIAMAAACASLVTEQPVFLHGAEAVRKSYPAFWDDMAQVCGSPFLQQGE